MSVLAPDVLHAQLAMDHDYLEHHLEQLIHAFETGDRDLAASAFREAEALLAAHFDLEEVALFPDFAVVEPTETEELRAEHRAFRAQLDALGVGVDLHATRLPAIRELVQALRRHATREDALLYRWADRQYSDPAHSTALGNLFSRGRSPAAPVT